ncbi:helix-turn-helix domain-containing protein [Streptomyces sporangiiformans]|uniref:LysR family transcriptional regulator n=1 Tax=Streptomyces sporangiiformans TaxID=2315329 RepID=A0A505DG11_9ACTN|nr:helix-turn-helix domain-containing protein [Streptomyces sporangiiformans]TPQ16849.1 LysR family transcriptional regulator [Streptomyces sporangiiformans]
MSIYVDGTVRDVAKGIQADLESLTPEMTSMFVEVIPEFRHDDAVRRLMVASTSSNLAAIVDMLALNISLDDITVPPAAAEYARRFAQHDLSLEALLRAYRLGEHMFVQWAVTVLRRLELSTDEALATTSRIALLVNSYIDQVIEGLIDIYENERRRWDARSDATRAAQVRAVLDAEGLDLASAETMLSTSLRGWHLAAIIWTGPGSADHVSSQLRFGAAMLAAATGKAPLTISADEQTSWAWISSAGKPVLDGHRLEDELREHPALRIAVGDPSPGLDGFRQTFRDAQRARNVAATGAGPDRALVLHSQVALAGLLVDHLTDVRAWAGRVLGDLMRDDEATVRLRETVQVFLDARGSFTDAAARMHVHKNTVHYRVRKAEEILGHPLTEHRLDIEVALLACAQLGLRHTEGA